MNLLKCGARFLVRGAVGDQIPEVLVHLAREQRWTSGSLAGLGGVADVQLAYFDLARKEYLAIGVNGVVELISLTGNLALVNGEPFWHLHAAVSDRDGRVTAGHLISMRVAVTLECWLDVSGIPVSRARDAETGLNLLDI